LVYFFGTFCTGDAGIGNRKVRKYENLLLIEQLLEGYKSCKVVHQWHEQELTQDLFVWMDTSP